MPFPPVFRVSEVLQFLGIASHVIDTAQKWFDTAGRVDCQVQDVSSIAELAPELTTLIRQHHQLMWYCKGLPMTLLCTSSVAYPHGLQCMRAAYAFACLDESDQLCGRGRPHEPALHILCVILSWAETPERAAKVITFPAASDQMRTP